MSHLWAGSEQVRLARLDLLSVRLCQQAPAVEVFTAPHEDRAGIHAAHLTACRGIIEQLELVEIDALSTAFIPVSAGRDASPPRNEQGIRCKSTVPLDASAELLNGALVGDDVALGSAQ
jgi:hypothetical protein